MRPSFISHTSCSTLSKSPSVSIIICMSAGGEGGCTARMNAACVTGVLSPSEPRFVTAAGRCLLNEVGLEEERDGLMAEEAACCLAELGSLTVSKQSCTHGSVLFGYSVSRLSVIPAGRGFSLSPCNFNGCRRIRQNLVRFPMN